MKLEKPKEERRRTMCGVCTLVAVRMVAPTIAANTFYGWCHRCDKSTMQRGMPGPIEEEAAPPPAEPDLEAILGPGEAFLIGEGSSTREITRAEALAALEAGEDGGTLRDLANEPI